MNAIALFDLLVLASAVASLVQAASVEDRVTAEIPSDGDDEFWERYANSPLDEAAEEYTVLNEEPTTSRSNEPTTSRSNEHTTSRSKRSTKCGLTPRITRAQRREVVRAHNALRRKEGAAGMAKMVWDKKLARRAQQWAAMCTWNHGMDTDCEHRRWQLGQNMVRLPAGSPRYRHVMMRHVVKMWWLEKEEYDFDNPTKCKGHKRCSHYGQVVWSSSQRVGCGIAWCPTITKGVDITRPLNNSLLIVCDYWRPGNILDVKPYVKGPPCTRCQDVVTKGYICNRRLCAECDPTKKPGCTCVRRTCKHGSFALKQCKCICKKGYFGELCEHECVCRDKTKYCKLPAIKNNCDNMAYVLWLKLNCPVTCPTFCPKPSAGDCP